MFIQKWLHAYTNIQIRNVDMDHHRYLHTKHNWDEIIRGWESKRERESASLYVRGLWHSYYLNIRTVPGEVVNILGGHSISHSKQKSVYVHVSYSEQFPRQSYFTVQFQNC
jgi:hypothetical protein